MDDDCQGLSPPCKSIQVVTSMINKKKSKNSNCYYLNFTASSKYLQERANEINSGSCSRMTPSCYTMFLNLNSFLTPSLVCQKILKCLLSLNKNRLVWTFRFKYCNLLQHKKLCVKNGAQM